MTVLREDFKQGTVTDSPLGAAATTINSAEFVDLRAVTGGSGEYLKLILDPAGVHGDPEIVYVTAHTASASAVTVERGREQTVAREHPNTPSPTIWKHGPTARDFGLDIGDGKFHYGSVAPQGWVFCRGQELNRNTYAKLFEVIGEDYGAGDGITTFNAPDMRGVFPVGASNVPGDYDLADTGGLEEVTLTSPQMPLHTHPGPSHAHSQTAHEHSMGHDHGSGTLNVTGDGDHGHGHSNTYAVLTHSHSDGTGNTVRSGGTASKTVQHSTTNASDNSGFHTHGLTGSTGSASTSNTGNGSAGGSTANTSFNGTGDTGTKGNDQAHENRPPFLAVNFCIYTGVY